MLSGIGLWIGQNVAASGASAPPAAMTLSATDKSANITLTNGNLTAQGPTVHAAVRASRPFTTGKYYWEMTFVNNADLPQAAIADSSANLDEANFWAQTDNVDRAANDSINVRYNGTSQSATAAGVQKFAYNGTTGLWWVGGSGGWGNGDPVAGTGGLSLAGMGATRFAAFQGDAGDKVTFNFGDSAFSYTVPTGFSAATSIA